jgi:hypothetical protein
MRSICSNETEEKYKSPNIPLLILDLILLPIHIIRMIIIYYWGSKYNLKGFQFLDVIMHADKPYFNKDDCNMIDTIGKDYRVVIRDDSRIFPLDIDQYLEVKQIKSHKHKKNDHKSKVKTGSTVKNKDDVWDISSEEVDDDDKKPKINKKNGDELDSKFIDDDSLSDDLSSDTDSDSDSDSDSMTEDSGDNEDKSNKSESGSDKTEDSESNKSTSSTTNTENTESSKHDEKSKKIIHNKVIDSIKAELDSAFDN